MQHWALTDVGVIRTQNQDAYHIVSLDDRTLLCVVCDGMGGAKSGNVASTLAADVFTREVQQAWKANMNADQIDTMLSDALKTANFTVYDQSRQFEEFRGMGTTLVALLLQGKKATFLNVGDSRGYIVDETGIRQITVDHSVVQMMVANGELTPEQARHYPGKNLITRAVGTEEQVVSDLFHQSLKSDECILLCTDGLTNLMDDQEILFEVAYEDDRENCCQRLVDLAKKRGAPDNVTCVLVSI